MPASRSPATAAAAVLCSASSKRPTRFPRTSTASRFSTPTTRSTPRKHGDKLDRWLKGDEARRLIVIAYDDREIMLNGKKVVGPDGGTFRATQRMGDALRPDDCRSTEKQTAPFTEYAGLDGRMHFYVHPNPENKILHTVLVGDMNGLVHAQTLGTPDEGKWGTFGGPRAYSNAFSPSPRRWIARNGPLRRSPAKALPAPLPASEERNSRRARGCHRRAGVHGASCAARPRRARSGDLREISAATSPSSCATFKPVPIAAHGDGTQSRHARSHARLPRRRQRRRLRPHADDAANRPANRRPLRLHAADAARWSTRSTPSAEVRLAPQPLTEDREAVATFVRRTTRSKRSGPASRSACSSPASRRTSSSRRASSNAPAAGDLRLAATRRPADPAAHDRPLRPLRRLQPRRPAGARRDRRSTASAQDHRPAADPDRAASSATKARWIRRGIPWIEN